MIKQLLGAKITGVRLLLGSPFLLEIVDKDVTYLRSMSATMTS